MSLKLPRSWEFNLKSDLGRIVSDISLAEGTMESNKVTYLAQTINEINLVQHLKLYEYQRSRSVSMMSNDQSALSSRLNNTLEKPVKSGWLKKQQKTFVKSWQQKYFALKGQQLYYYKELDDGKPQGSLFLPRSTVSQVSCSPDDAGKFIFEIIPGTSVDQNKSTPDPYVLMANSQAEMEEWVNAIKKAAGFPSGAVFGQRLVDTINYEKKYGCHLVPILMKKCADFIRERGLNEEGIFRLPGQDNLVKQLKEAFDAGERPSFSRDTDVHTVASLFKLYLRELPEPVIPWSQYEDCLNCEKMISIDEEKGHEDLMKQILLLPKENYNLLCFICRFLYEVQKNSSVNKMSVDNLAMVIGVNLLKPKTEEPEALMRSAPQIQKLMTVLISRHEKFFSKASDLPEDPVFQKTDNKKVQLSRSSVGWDAADENLSPGAELPRSQMKLPRDSLSSSTSEEGLTSLEDDDSLSKDKQGSWKAIPRKRTQTLPITNRLIVGKNGDNVNNLKEEILRGDFWSSPVSNQPCLKSSPPGHKRTLSEEFDHHRTSTYDNVPSTQSYSGNDSGPCLNALSVRNGDGEQPIQQKQSLSYLKNFNSTRAESKDGNSYDMSPILMDLQREMENQKKQLEERIHSLEKENYEVWKKVLKLSEDLEKEKNKRMALEITLKNAEQSRNDAEKRNKHLEQEIQGFVSAMSQASSKPE